MELTTALYLMIAAFVLGFLAGRSGRKQWALRKIEQLAERLAKEEDYQYSETQSALWDACKAFGASKDQASEIVQDYIPGKMS